MERRMKKAQLTSKANSKIKQELKLKDRDIFQARKDLKNARDQNQSLSDQLKKMQANNSNKPVTSQVYRV